MMARRDRIRIEMPIPIPALAPGDRSGFCGGEGGMGEFRLARLSSGLGRVWGDVSPDRGD